MSTKASIIVSSSSALPALTSTQPPQPINHTPTSTNPLAQATYLCVRVCVLRSPFTFTFTFTFSTRRLFDGPAEPTTAAPGAGERCQLTPLLAQRFPYWYNIEQNETGADATKSTSLPEVALNVNCMYNT